MRLFSPAKINLFLRVLRKREDGYHDLASLFQAIDLGDYLTFTPSEADHLSCTDPTLLCNRTNLIWKAVDLFRQKTGYCSSFHIHLEKHIPVQSGLGGGSSNAATTLWALNDLLGKPASEEDLGKWAAEIGSDISFFFSQGTAYCTGKGECVKPLLPLKQRDPLWIIKPVHGLSTPLIFKQLHLEACSTLNPEELLSRWIQGDPILINDLEVPAFQVLPSLEHVKNSLKKGGELAMMTGSGTGFFSFGKKPRLDSDCQLFEASFLCRSPTRWYVPSRV